jgi:hypothetical protein
MRKQGFFGNDRNKPQGNSIPDLFAHGRTNCGGAFFDFGWPESRTVERTKNTFFAFRKRLSREKMLTFAPQN